MASASVYCVEPELNSSAKTSFKITDILGVALFDLNGLPREYFVTAKNPTTDWVQIVFQALGVRSLLASSLELKDFRQVTITLKTTTAIVVRRPEDYIALKFDGQLLLNSQANQEQLRQLIGALNSDVLQQHPHFRGN